MSCRDTRSLIDSYIEWFKEGIRLEEIEDSCEIITPFVDRNNDAIVIYLERSGDEYYLTDDGDTLAELWLSGVEIKGKREKIMTTILNGFGVERKDDELVVKTSKKDFPRKKHDLIQAILSINDMFMLSRHIVRGLFFEQVKSFLQNNEVHFGISITLKGKSGMDHNFDFHIAPARDKPEILIQAIGRPEKQTIITKVLFPYEDVRAKRPTPVEIYAFLNDEDEDVSSDLTSYISNSGGNPVPWSKRESVLEQFPRIV